ncbi:MAG: hypothetical protein J7L73_02980 [Anaerolineales bacterium]|nr:hypothetical protein [Anaerolineales bacterium]
MICLVKSIAVLFLTSLLASCANFIATPDLPTLIPEAELPTIIAQTAQALVPPTNAPDLATPTRTQPSSITPTKDAGQSQSATPSITLTPVPTKNTPQPLGTAESPAIEIPYAKIQIIRPGPLSKIVSPIKVQVFLSPGEGKRIQMELIGEDGRLMYRKVFRYAVPPATLINLFKDIDFEINGVAETARLVVSTYDAHGRIQALASEDLILLSMGDSDINPPGDLLENIVIQQPEPKQLIQGGKIIVAGLVRTLSDQPLVIELINENGGVVGSRLAAISQDEEGGHRLFAAEVPYQVSTPTWVRITVTEHGERLPGTIHISTIEALLSP